MPLSLKITTPPVTSGALPLRQRQGIADHTVDNRPCDSATATASLHTDPDGETLIGTSGIMPGVHDRAGPPGLQASTTQRSSRRVSFTGSSPPRPISSSTTRRSLVTANDRNQCRIRPGRSAGRLRCSTSSTSALTILPAVFGVAASERRRCLGDQGQQGQGHDGALSLIDATCASPDTTAGRGGVRSFAVSGPAGQRSQRAPRPGSRYRVTSSSTSKVRRGGSDIDADVFRSGGMRGIRSFALPDRQRRRGGAVPPVGSIFNFVRLPRHHRLGPLDGALAVGQPDFIHTP